MPVTERPNKEAIIKAAEIFRDAMRPIITRTLRQVRGRTLEDTIRYSLPSRQQDDFSRSLRNYPRDIEGAIDIAMVPLIVSKRGKILSI